ncbi:MAG TPA: GNAT family N-acetyltransferase [Thermoanaerobaculia bacterium]|nr:GNAT family N-acetyltransferase [Thermoanaerobaculia bacterium]
MPAVSLRPITEEDLGFLLRVYGSTREEELALATDWTPEQKAAFVTMQFQAQHTQYREAFQDGRFDVVLVDGVPAGRLYVHPREEEIRMVDIALLPEFRGRGIGTLLLRDLFAEAEAARKPLTIHVERFNKALRLYERLGFRPIADRGVYFLMEWRPTNLS